MKKVNKSSPISKIKGHQIEEVINTSCGLSVFKMKKEQISGSDLDYIEHLCNKDGTAGLIAAWRNIRRLVEEKFKSTSIESTPGEEDFLDYWWKKWPESTRNLKYLERSAHFRGCRDAWFAAKKVEGTP